jgi:hypothetical protein
MDTRNRTWAAQEEVEDWDWEGELYMHERLVQKLVSKTDTAEKKRNKKGKQNTATRGLAWLQRVEEMTPQQAAEEWARQQACWDVLQQKK